MDYGLTKNGFIAKPLHVILEEERAAYRNTFGEDIDLSNDSIDGAYVGNQAIKLAQLWEQLEGLWAAGDVDSAGGIYLDRLAALVSVQRQPSSGTAVYAALWGEPGTTVSSGHMTRLASGEIFRLTRSVVIDAGSLLGFTFRVTEAVYGATYSFQLGDTVISHTSDGDDDEGSIQAALAAQIDVTAYSVVDGGEDGVTVHSMEGLRAFSLAMTDPRMEIVSLGSFGVYEAETPGPIFVSVGALNSIVTNVNGLDSVVNYATGITGRNVESDTELRLGLGSRQRQATANEMAIQNAILAINGVHFARVYSNRAMSPSNGRPPKSFEAVVVGGDDREIAEVIFEVGPAGIEPFGNIKSDVLDSEGFVWEIGFSRPVNRYVWIRVEYARNPEEELPIDVISAIQDNIIAWSQTGINVGVDLIFQRMFKPVYLVPGIGYATISVAATDDLTPPPAGSYLSANIVIGETEIAVIDRSRIIVQEQAE